MKRPGLSPRFLPATLFLLAAWNVAAQETSAAQAVQRAERSLEKTDSAPAGANPAPLVTQTPAAEAELEALLRRAIEVDSALRARFDANGNGTLDNDEWRVAQRRVIVALAGPGAADQARLEAVDAEVARRRRQREQAAEAFTAGTIATTKEQARLQMVADEVARRRIEREAQGRVPGKTTVVPVPGEEAGPATERRPESTTGQPPGPETK